MATVSTIGPKTVVRGNVHGEGDLTIEGRVEGDVNVEGNVSVSPLAEVKGSIAAQNVVVAGTVEGDVSSADTVTVDPNAKVLGDMTGPRVHIAEGATVRGMVRTEGEPPRVPRERVSRTAANDALGRRNEAPRPAPIVPAAEPSFVEPSFVEPSFVEPKHEARRDKPPKKGKGKGKDKNKKKRPPDPVVPVLAKRTKGKKKGEKRAR